MRSVDPSLAVIGIGGGVLPVATGCVTDVYVGVGVFNFSCVGAAGAGAGD
ncbi:hypothetical protein KUH03_24685 [Sphingobacterium sp. E70]|nr:hypothetical protein [Sphingobacterium sp. E70]ULT22561.1 hypothetical protein KUH03_24685 [Sphingobacterium sp. E70]